MKQREEREISVAMAEAAGKEETTPGTLKEKTEESEGIGLVFVLVGLAYDGCFIEVF